MLLFRSVAWRFSVILIAAAPIFGCRSNLSSRPVGIGSASASPPSFLPNSAARSSTNAHTAANIVPVSHTESPNTVPLADTAGGDPFQDHAVLSPERLIEEVQTRNPSLASVRAAWGAASNRYPQVVALDDPILQSMYAPHSFASSSNVQSSYYIGAAQRIPWPGKLRLRGQQALWETTAADYDIGETALRLAEAARLAYFDYYLNQRLLDLVAANLNATEDFRNLARTKYEANQVSQQDVLQAEVELARLEQQQIEVAQDRQVATARINTLLHRRPDHPLPPPELTLTDFGSLPPVTTLRDLAVSGRPELQALAARIQSERTAVELACKEFYPDFELMGRYDRFWIDKEQQPQVGVNVNVPLNQNRRRAAVHEALFRVHKLQAEYGLAVDTIQNDVQAAYARVQGTLKTVQLYESRIIPTAKDNLSAARAEYTAGTADFLRVIAAQREIIELSEKQQEAIAELHRRRAELERAVGVPLAETQNGGSQEVPPMPGSNE